MDRNAKVRVMTYARCYTLLHRTPGQHLGPLTRAFLDVLRALLWSFHNQHSGRCFPDYDSIAAAAHVHRSTVSLAIAALEAAGVLQVQNRLVEKRITRPEVGLLGPMDIRVVRRTSNAYRFMDDPLRSRGGERAKSGKSPVTTIQDSLSLRDPAWIDELAAFPALLALRGTMLEQAEARLRKTMDQRSKESGPTGPA